MPDPDPDDRAERAKVRPIAGADPVDDRAKVRPIAGADPDPANRAERAHAAVEGYLAKRRQLETALRDIAVLKHTLREMAADLEPRMQGIEGRLVVLARTVGNLLAELDRSHTTVITRLRPPVNLPEGTDPNDETRPVVPEGP